ncbi:hypothetical protein GBF35_01925 [Nonomuraea phyllanthi]|uniref:hypothetical protein n=1 Tax=Nonomuraea phyllanthi TaxID=2219224 RepID=UPI00129312A9|nr:hypothetical protein [Nonomuraea phyllanthi]QFY05603.1 hypothetical protein GBF35_01925 [Nonomuraea phyllanthi]
MSQGKVSVWVPIVVALLGIVGLVVGQLVNAWREDRRWQREMAREDLRWEREQARERDKRDHEAQLQWGKERLEAYTHFAKTMSEWRELLCEVEAVLRADQQPASAQFDRIRDLNSEAALLTARITLVGSVFLQARCHDLWSFYEAAYKDMLSGQPALSDTAWAEDLYVQAYYALLDNIREELGTPVKVMAREPEGRMGGSLGPLSGRGRKRWRA